MLSRLRKASRRIWARVTIIFLVCLFPLLGLQAIIQEWGSNLIREQVYATAYANVDYLSSHFNSSIEGLHTTAEYLCSVDLVREFFVFHNTYRTSEYYQKIAGVQDFLFRMTQSNPFISEIRLCFPRSSLIITADRRDKAYLSTDLHEITPRISSARASDSLLIEDNGEYRVCTMVSGANETQLPAIYLEIILDRNVMAQHLSSFTASGEELSFQYNHTEDTVLFSNGFHLSDSNARRFGDSLRAESGAPYSCSFHLDGVEYVLVAVFVPAIRTSFAQLIQIDHLEFIPHMLRLGMYLFIGLFSLALGILFTMMRRQINTPTQRLLAAFDATGEGKFDTRIADDVRAWPYEYQQLTLHFNEMNAHTQQLIAEIYEQQINLRHAQLKQLQAQINPHFLYNSFFLLRSVIGAGEQEQADLFLGCLGRYFQYITNNASESASLAEEYGHAQDYLSIQLMRFEDMLQLDVPPLPDHLKAVSVPRLMLQPLYENVLVHGSWNSSSVRCIRLLIEETPDFVILHICDNGEGVTDALIDEVRSSLTGYIPYEFTSGLTNIHHRLTLLGGGLTVARSAMGGFEVIASIPKERTAHV